MAGPFDERMTDNGGRGGSRDGFMLVEVLATMTISALLLAALFSIASLTLRTSSRIERQSEAIEGRTRILAALSRDIERAIPVRWAGKDAGFIFSGSERTMAFAVENARRDGSVDVGAVLIDSARGVTRRVGMIPPAATSFDALALGQPEVITGAEYSIAYAYYARLDDGHEALLDRWLDNRQFPVAIRLTLRSGDGVNSTMRVALHANTEPGCGFPDKGQCGLRPVAASGDQAQSQSTEGGGG